MYGAAAPLSGPQGGSSVPWKTSVVSFDKPVQFAAVPRRTWSWFLLPICFVTPCLVFTAVGLAVGLAISGDVAFVVVVALFVLGKGLLATRAWSRSFDGPRDPNAYMYVFLFATGLLGWILGMVYGLEIRFLLKDFLSISGMQQYQVTEPSKVTADNVLDAGLLFFTESAKPEVSLSGGFRSTEMYCVAPISPGVEEPDIALSQLGPRYTFWAVGTGCCSGTSPDFHCGEYNNSRAHAAVRSFDDAARPYYRLAVQQAEATHRIRAPHPIFVEWKQDPISELVDMGLGVRSRVIFGICAFAVLQFFLTNVLAFGMYKFFPG